MSTFWKGFSAFWVLMFLVVGAVRAAQDPVFSTGAGAIRGFDPVAYFTEL